MPTGYRLSHGDVHAIFRSLHLHTSLPSHPKFKVVSLREGFKWAPPPRKYEVGIYVLLNPKTQQVLPCHLNHLVMENVPEGKVYWTISGPQVQRKSTSTPSKTIQQRYCYPRGDDEYCKQTGARLWTAYRSNGTERKEDAEFRILEVYHSTVRENCTKHGLSLRGDPISQNIGDLTTVKAAPRKRKASVARKLGNRRALASSPAPLQPQVRAIQPTTRKIVQGPDVMPPYENDSAASSAVENQNRSVLQGLTPDSILRISGINGSNTYLETVSQQGTIPSIDVNSYLFEEAFFGFGSPKVGIHSQDEIERWTQAVDRFHDMETDPVISVIATPGAESSDDKENETHGISSLKVKPNARLDADNLTEQLARFQQQLKNRITNSSPGRAGHLTGIITTWAGKMAKNPLDVSPMHRTISKSTCSEPVEPNPKKQHSGSI